MTTTMISAAELRANSRECVTRGARLLDEKLPGWYDQIDIGSLEMSSNCNCVLGQLGSQTVNLDRLGRGTFGDERDPYYEMVVALGLSRADEGDEALGFDVIYQFHEDYEDGPAVLTTFPDLRDAWVVEIEARRAA